jgi:ribosomal protein S14
MRYIVPKDKKRRLNFNKIEKRYRIMKIAKSSNKLLPTLVNDFSKFYFDCMNKDFFFTRIVNRCVITGRSGGVLQFFKMSRMEIKSFFGAGKLYGFKRSSW